MRQQQTLVTNGLVSANGLASNHIIGNMPGNTRTWQMAQQPGVERAAWHMVAKARSPVDAGRLSPHGRVKCSRTVCSRDAVELPMALATCGMAGVLAGF